MDSRACRDGYVDRYWTFPRFIASSSSYVILLIKLQSRLIATVREEKLDFVEDETNVDTEFTERNAIRATMNDLEPFIHLNWPYNPIQPERSLPPPVSSPLATRVQEYGILRADVDNAGTPFSQLLLRFY